MKIIKSFLIEDSPSSNDFYVYEDTSTGIKYIFNGKELVSLDRDKDGNPSKPNANKHNEIDYDKLAEEEEERKKQIEQEVEVLKNDLDNGDMSEESTQAALEEIEDLLSDASFIDDLLRETDNVVERDRQRIKREKKRAERESSKYSSNSGIVDFALDLDRLLARELKKLTKTSWNKLNKKADGTGVIKPGKLRKNTEEKPSVYVYYDQSGSWGASDIAVGNAALSTINTKYVETDRISMYVFYFGNTVGTDPNSVGRGTGAGKLLVDHIREHRPDNVVVMTDYGFDEWGEIFEADPVLVKGGVFLLFRRNQVSKGLVNKVVGKKFSKIYSI